MVEEKISFKRTLTTKDLLVYGIIFMIPVAPLAFYGSFLVPANGMVALAYLVGGIAMLFTGFSYAAMAKRYPFSGSVYNYVQRGAHPNLGFIAGWGITLDYLLIPSITYIISAQFGHELLPTIPIWLWVIIIATFNTIVNYLGIDYVSKISWLLFFLQLIVLVLFFVLTIRELAVGNVQPHVISLYNPKHFNFSGVLQATGIVIVSYLGFDAISTLSEEAITPQKSVGKAIIFSIIGIGSLFIITTVLAGFIVPNYQSLNPDTAFSGILYKVGGHPLVYFADIVIVLSFGFAGGQEGQTSVSRILYSMGRDGILPNFLSKLHKKFKTPFIAILLVGLISLIISLTFSVDVVSNLLSFGALFGFMTLNLTVIWHLFIQNPNKNFINIIYYLLSPFIGFSVSLWIFSSLDMSAKIVGGLWLLVGFAILAFKTKFFTIRAPQYDLEL